MSTLTKRISAVLAALGFASCAALAGNVAIINGASETSEAFTTSDITSHLVSLEHAVGNTTTVFDTPPANLAGYSQVWDIRFSNASPLTLGVDTEYVNYLKSGHAMFVMGENSGFLTRDDSVFAFVGKAGGGTLTFGAEDDTQTVFPPLNRNISGSLMYEDAGVVTNPAKGQFATEASNDNGSAVLFKAGTLSNDPTGTLAMVLDVNFMQAGANANSVQFLKNLIGFETVAAAENSGIRAAFWLGNHGNVWSNPLGNFATDMAGTKTTELPNAMTDVTFSATGAANQEDTVLGADFTIKSLTINDPVPVSIGGPQTLTISGTTGATGITVNTGAGLATINANLVLGAGSSAVTVNQGAGLIIGGGLGGASRLDKEGAGLLILSGSNSFTGGTVINSGLVVVDSPTALGRGNVSLIGGELTTDPQPINVGGDYTQGAQGALILHINGAGVGQYDTLNVAGHAALAGYLGLQFPVNFPLVKGDKLTVVTADGGVSGHFNSDVYPTNTILLSELFYHPNSVVLEELAGSFKPFAHTLNQMDIAKTLDRAENDPKAASLIAVLNTLPAGTLTDVLEDLSPSGLSAMYEISFAAANTQQNNLENRMADVRAGASGFTSTLNVSNTEVSKGYDGKNYIGGDNKTSYPEPIPPGGRLGVFISGNGDFVDVGRDSNAKGYDFDTGGITLGADYRVTEDFAIGAAFDYANTSTSLDSRGSINVNSGKGGVYATLFDKTAGFYLNTYAGGGYNSYDTRRSGLLGDARGSTDGGEFNTFLSGGYDVHFHGLTAGPTASVQYSYVEFNHFTEHGSAAPLSYVSQNQNSLRTNAGIHLEYPIQSGRITITPQARASWQHEFAYNAIPIDADFARTGDYFQVFGPKIGRDSALIEAGIRVQWSPRFATFLNYDGKINPSYEAHAVNGGFDLTF